MQLCSSLNILWHCPSLKWQPTPVFLPGKSHGRRSLVGYSPRGRKESDTTERLHFHFHASKVMLKILQARLQQNVNRELPDVQAGFRKDRGTRDQIASKRVPKKTSTSALLTMPKPLTVWITANCEKFLKRWEYQTTLLAA